MVAHTKSQLGKEFMLKNLETILKCSYTLVCSKVKTSVRENRLRQRLKIWYQFGSATSTMRATVDGSITARSIPSMIQWRWASLDGRLRDGGSFMSCFSMVSIGVSSTSSVFSGGGSFMAGFSMVSVGVSSTSSVFSGGKTWLQAGGSNSSTFCVYVCFGGLQSLLQ